MATSGRSSPPQDFEPAIRDSLAAWGITPCLSMVARCERLREVFPDRSERREFVRTWLRRRSKRDLALYDLLTDRRSFQYIWSTAYDELVPRLLVVAAVLAARRPARVLDVGCAEGVGGMTLAGLFPDIAFVGIETDGRALALNRELRERHDPQNYLVQQQSLLDFDDWSAVDLVLDLNCVYTLERPVDALRRIASRARDATLVSAVHWTSGDLALLWLRALRKGHWPEVRVRYGRLTSAYNNRSASPVFTCLTRAARPGVDRWFEEAGGPPAQSVREYEQRCEALRQSTDPLEWMRDDWKHIGGADTARSFEDYLRLGDSCALTDGHELTHPPVFEALCEALSETNWAHDPSVTVTSVRRAYCEYLDLPESSSVGENTLFVVA